jgi:ABC-type amino acid transport system permease subunit
MKPFLVWAIVFGIYFVISYPLSKLSRYLEKRIDFAL